MSVLSGLEPERVFYYFEKICGIPHGSYHEKAISDYLVDFAKEHGRTVYQDDLYNVIMLVEASEGYEGEEPLILQGHMDMVCEKTAAATLDMEKEGLCLETDGTYVYAKDTTLGGDDGIAVAYMLAIAERSDLPHPPLELVFTVCEEVGMEGADAIDLSNLRGRRMLNLDSEEEGIFLSSCAGGISTHSKLPIQRQSSEEMDWYTLEVTGLLGGHSGCEIHKGRANANRILARVLEELRRECTIALYALEGGKKDNAIPLYAAACIGLKTEEAGQVMEQINRLDAELKTEYAETDAGITLVLHRVQGKERRSVLGEESVSALLALLTELPDGVQSMSREVEGLVETSLNLGIVCLYDDHLFLQHSIRSSVTASKLQMAEQVEKLVISRGGTVERKGDYPAWEYREQSAVRNKVIRLYQELYGTEPVVEGIHAGLECGLLAGKIKDLDCVSMGPDILDIHTTSERLDIESTRRVYAFLLEYLKRKDDEDADWNRV
ncbi:MAG: aminoacyl-histidine dipeptidase [Lachnospiraceae bacterium]|nr:aminoacyl-histidine dipeptidase [Lachnospiraceae bacterium]